MNILTTEKLATVISVLVEGCSVPSTVRPSGVAKDTILKLLAQVGEVRRDDQDQALRKIPRKRRALDEI